MKESDSMKTPSINQPKLFKSYDNLDSSTKNLFSGIKTEIELISKKNGVTLIVVDESLQLGGNNFSLKGKIIDGDKIVNNVRIKISNSENKNTDMERELYMINYIEKMGYPVPKIYLDGVTNSKNHFYIQEFILGKNVREIKTNKFKIYNKIQNFFIDLHSNTSLPGYGKIYNDHGVWKGESSTWSNALRDKLKLSFRRTYAADLIKDHDLEDKLLEILEINNNILNVGEAKSLLHGDAGLINFMGYKNELVAILDPEFAVVGDPAYEFSDKIGEKNDYSFDFLQKYIRGITDKGININSDSFLRRGLIYSPFIVADIIPNLWEAGNTEGAKYFISILPDEIQKALMA